MGLFEHVVSCFVQEFHPGLARRDRRINTNILMASDEKGDSQFCEALRSEV
jgi:hypothetical protein